MYVAINNKYQPKVLSNKVLNRQSSYINHLPEVVNLTWQLN